MAMRFRFIFIIKKYFSVFFLFFSVSGFSQKQSQTYPKVGEPIPNFIFSDVQNYPRKRITIEEFKGKWLILDWWTKYCSYCIESFPKVNILQQKFANKVQFLFIGYTGSSEIDGNKEPGNKAVRDIYARATEKLKLNVPIAYDSLLYQKLNIGSTPYIIVIDPNGIVRGITYHLTENEINQLITGKQVTLKKAYRQNEEKPQFNDSLPFLTFENGGTDTGFLYRSLLAHWVPDMPVRIVSSIFWPGNNGRFEVLGANLERLYNYAYIGESGWAWNDTLYGKVYPHPILDIKDSTSFKPDFNSGRNIYCYSLIVPAGVASRLFLMNMMQKDLSNYFNFNVSVETRMMPYWKLTASKEAKLKLKTSNNNVKYFEQNGAGLVYKNVPIKTLIGALWSYNQFSPPFIDETGIDDNIDISINALLTDFNDFRRALNENGLNLVRGEKEMKVIVIRDSKSQL